MKKCSQCGFLNEDKPANCKVCNNILVNETIEKKASFDDGFLVVKSNAATKEPFEVTLFDKIIAISATAALIASILLMFLSKNQSLSSLVSKISLILVGVLITFFPNQIWALSRKNHEKWFKNAGRLEPSDYYKNFRKAFIVIYLVVGIFSVILKIKLGKNLY